ncbi:hypothetical protein I79_010367 [Cricetulus griseus]|uniref:Uncharacterized protein n=1 Tax=Cricetulus griseus TaxID=10029 RepID=G3HIA0_CRIGR|nr:hypothetical protein I79_010367 [Cricetulus griseus]
MPGVKGRHTHTFLNLSSLPSTSILPRPLPSPDPSPQIQKGSSAAPCVRSARSNEWKPLTAMLLF